MRFFVKIKRRLNEHRIIKNEKIKKLGNYTVFSRADFKQSNGETQMIFFILKALLR